jgi:G:T/U-mismatch repair DNA glycosylase/predicted GNAT family acetyltransferase
MPATKEIECHPLQPFLPENARVLMLGSFPPPKERWCMDFFYPNPQNDMWRIMGQVFFNDKCHFEVQKDKVQGTKAAGKKVFNCEEIVSFCRKQGIAIFDTAQAVRRLQGNAADEHLEIVERTDIAALLQQIPSCHDICCTGGKAAETLGEILHTIMPKVGEYIETTFADRTIRFWRMPSSSRAYPLSFDKKAAAYQRMFNKLNKPTAKKTNTMINIQHKETDRNGIFDAWLDDQQVGEMTYQRPTPQRMIIDHTRVFDGFEGRGIARQMVLAAVDFARTNSRQIAPVCSYARALLTRTEEYKDLLA